MSRAVNTPNERLLVSTTGKAFECRCFINGDTSAKRPDTQHNATSRLPPQLVSERSLEFDIRNAIECESTPVADIKISFNNASAIPELHNHMPYLAMISAFNC